MSANAPERLVVQLLGPVALVGAPDADEVLTQPKRIALLTILGVAGPGTFVRRDRITALLWPDMDPASARGALRKALHGLRQGLGEDAVPARGAEEVALDAATVTCDVSEFRRAVQEDRLAAAIEHYRGPLLDGFFVDASPFERWLDEERAHLAEAAADAAWTLAQRYETGADLTSATRWARRAARLARSDERRIRRVMELMARAGDRAGALRIYDGLVRELHDDLQLEPTAETKARLSL